MPKPKSAEEKLLLQIPPNKCSPSNCQIWSIALPKKDQINHIKFYYGIEQ